MKTAGIIAEYNPFHNGHAYHIREVRHQTGADYVIVVMSGNFMQRGVPAMLDKYTRARMALENGADLVLELPCIFACSSAELFAKGGVSLLCQLGVVDFLGFGCENDDLELLNKAASLLSEEPEEYRLTLQDSLREGNSFPTARGKAISSCLQDPTIDSAFLSSPNNILALEYLKAIKGLSSKNSENSLKPVAIKRAGASYHEDRLCASYSSALAIRKVLLSQEQEPLNTGALKDQVPDSVLHLLEKSYQKTYPVTSQDFSAQLHYKLLSEVETGYTEYLDVSKDISDKIKKNLNSYLDFDSFCMLLKSKDLTYTRISRCLLHILLNIHKEDLLPQAPYARVLGFRKDCAPLFKEIKEKSSLPLLAVAADARKFLADPSVTDRAKKMLTTDLTATRIYNSAALHRFHTTLPDEFGAPVLKV